MKHQIKINQRVPEEVIRAAQLHAESVFPEEAVGAVYDGVVYVPLKNTHEEPTKHFRIDSSAVDWERFTHLIHNHPAGILCPSKADMECWELIRVPMGIFVSVKSKHEISHSQMIWYDPTDHSYPLEGRPFVNGIFDCYGLIRDWYAQEMSIELPDFPRDDSWFETNPDENLFEKNFKTAGFSQTKREPQRGDVFLMRFYLGKTSGKEPINHGAVYLGDDKILHQYGGRLSSIDSASRWLSRYLVKTVRYRGDK